MRQSRKGPGQAQILYPQWRLKDDLNLSITHCASLKIFFFKLIYFISTVFCLCACLGITCTMVLREAGGGFRSPGTAVQTVVSHRACVMGLWKSSHCSDHWAIFPPSRTNSPTRKRFSLFFFLSKYFVDQEKKIDEYLLLLDFLMKKFLTDCIAIRYHGWWSEWEWHQELKLGLQLVETIRRSGLPGEGVALGVCRRGWGRGLWSFKTRSHSQLASPHLALTVDPNVMVIGSPTLWNSKTRIKCFLL